MIRWSNIIVPIGTAIVAGRFVSVAFWDTSKQGLLVALSVIAAGVLVRLARGLPFTNPDHYELDEIKKLTGAVSQIIRSLRLLIILVLIGMMSLILAKPILDSALTSLSLNPHADTIEGTTSGFIGLVLGYIMFRMLQVVKSDQELTELQATFIVRAVERKQVKSSDKLETKSVPTPFKNPEGYGRVIQ